MVLDERTVVTLTRSWHGPWRRACRGHICRTLSGSVTLCPQTDRATAKRRIDAADPFRYDPEAVLVSSAASDPVPTILRCSFTHEPIFS